MVTLNDYKRNALEPDKGVERKKIWVEEYGCSASVSDSEIIRGIILKAGYELARDAELADLNLIVTCGVKDATEHKMISRIKAFAHMQKPAIVAGCLPKADRKLVEKFFPSASLLGPGSLDSTLEVIKNSLLGRKAVAITDSPSQKFNLPMLRVNPIVGIVQISTGCLSDCSFCQTKLAKGMLRSFRIGDIVRQVELTLLEGCKEIWLTSTDNGCYGLDISTDLVELLKACTMVPGKYKIRVGMMNPAHVPAFKDRLIATYLANTKIFNFLHIPVQSGSDRILRKMKRRHTVAVYKDLVESFRDHIPGVTIATDIITGFPSETESDFQKTIDLIEGTEPDVVNSSRFSPRPGTAASKFVRVDLDQVIDRTKRLHQVISKVSTRRNNFWKGWEGNIIVDEVYDSYIQGRNYAYKPVILEKKVRGDNLGKRDLLGSVFNVKITEISKFSLKASILS